MAAKATDSAAEFVATGSGSDLCVVDAHQHFWDPGTHYYPWLNDEPPIPFRYGDYRAIRRRYLPPDYLEDSAAFQVVKTVYVEAEWNPADPLGEMRYIGELRREYGLPSVAVAQAWLDHSDAPHILAQQSAFPFVRSVRHKPRANGSPNDAAPGGMTDSKWRAGFAELARNGLRFDLQTPWWHLGEGAELAAAYPDTQIILNHTGLPSDRSVAGLAGWKRAMATLGHVSQRRREDIRPRPAGSGVDSGGKQRYRAHGDRPLRRNALHVREQFPGRQPVRDLRHHLRRISCHRQRPRGGRTTRAVPRQRDPYLRNGVNMPQPRIGYVGVGLMGLPMVRRLVSLGYPVTAYDILEERTQAAHAAGARTADSPADAAREADFVFLNLPTTDAVDAAVFGDRGVARAVRPPQLVVDFSTVKVDSGKAFAAKLRAHTGCGWVDAPVSGGPPASGAGTLTVMAGGDSDEIARVGPVMADISARFTHMGPVGSGLSAKMINQLIVGCGHAVMAEALAMAEAAGIDAGRIPECLAGGHADGTLLQKALSAHGPARLRAAGLCATVAEGPRDGQRIRRRVDTRRCRCRARH